MQSTTYITRPLWLVNETPQAHTVDSSSWIIYVTIWYHFLRQATMSVRCPPQSVTATVTVPVKFEPYGGMFIPKQNNVQSPGWTNNWLH